MNLKLISTASAVVLLSGIATAANANQFQGYAESGRDSVVRNGFGECWRTSNYKDNLAIIGCDAKDSDGDGVIDSKDQCPTTPKGEAVNAVGCPLDSDGDGVVDEKDACPGTPKGVKVDVLGCNPDSDNDGVRDHWDQCPNTPAGKVVDSKGCHKAEEIHAGPVYFDFNSAKLTAEGMAILDAVSADLASGDIKSIMVTGHTDSVGSDGYNVKLGEKRAMAVADYLSSKGVDAGKISTQTKGEADPADSNKTNTGRAHNRRVTVHGMI